MTIALLTAAMLAQPTAHVGSSQMRAVVEAILPAAIKHDIDPVLMAAVVMHESGGSNVVSHRRGRGLLGADVGAFQIHCWPATYGCVKKYKNLNVAAMKAARILALGKKLCSSVKRRPEWLCKRGFWARYNPGSERWSRNLRRRYDSLRAWISRRDEV